MTTPSVEAQVLANIRAQPIGAATVADFALPEAFLRRVAARVLQISFQQHFRLIVPDETGQREDVPWLPPGLEEGHAEEAPSPATVSMPALRGFRPHEGTPGDAPPPAGNPDLIALVAQRLAKDGLLLTAAKALRLITGTDAGHEAAVLESAGLPVDLLEHFKVSEREVGQPSPPQAALDWIRAHVVTAPESSWARALSKVEFNFQPTAPHLRAIPDAGASALHGFRLQLSRGSYWLGPGDGGSVDIARQLLEVAPLARIVALIERCHVDALKATSATWPSPIRDRIELRIVDAPLSQWAQDNGKHAVDADGRPAIVLPRYASRGEQITQYIPGDTHIDTALTASGFTSARSSLLFQGGNLLLVQEAGGGRVLLIGEAELYRNQVLGLTREQVLAAFAAEFQADKCVVLPAASVHIDYEVTCRVSDQGVTAFVIDTAAGARLVFAAGVERLAETGVLTSSQAEAILLQVEQHRIVEGVGAVWAALQRASGLRGPLPLRVARLFKASPVDSGVGNLRRLLVAMDLLMSAAPGAAARVADPNVSSHLRLMARHQEDRTALRAALRNLGWRIVPVPGLAEGEDSVNPLNGLHTPNSYLMPCYNGLYTRIDEAAHSAISGALPGLQVQPIQCGESLRRDGALRCSAAAF